MPQKLVLVIEDDPALGQAYVDIIALEGHQAELIPDGQVALSRLAEIAPDLILLDMHLPHVSGLDILKAIGDDSRLSKTWVVVMTANPEMAAAAKEFADSVFFKPVNFAQINEILELIK